jgi:nitroimidazol reductase NimA-like FMN-containing flavoprotein (pyridoxamine 5'-phosphate oxidase superfamily)
MPTLKELADSSLAALVANVRFLSLATVSEDGPVIRSIGSWGLQGRTLFFSTAKGSDKVVQLQGDPRVSAQLLAEGQELPGLKNVVLQGSAKLLETDTDRATAIAAIGARNPRFKERAEKGELGGNAIFAVKAGKIKVVDFSKGVGPAALAVYQG